MNYADNSRTYKTTKIADESPQKRRNYDIKSPANK